MAKRPIHGQFLDAYCLQRVVSVQGCLAVYEALAPDGRQVAIRAVCVDASPALHRRLDNEYASLTHLAGFQVVPAVLATGRTTTERYLVTQWLPGRPLRQGDQAPPLHAVVLAFAELHAQGVVHGDVNGRNILINGDQDVRIIDFEGSRRLDGSIPLGRVCGPVATRFAPPEFFHALRGTMPFSLTPAWDQYAVAAVLYFQLTGHCHRDRPVNPTDDTEPPAVDAFPLDGSGTLPDVFATALANDPLARFPSMIEFAEALERSACG